MLAISGLLVALSGTAEAGPPARHAGQAQPQAQPPARHAVHHPVAAPPPAPVRPAVGVGAGPPPYVPPPHVGVRWRTGYYVSAISSPVSWETVAPAATPATRDADRSGMVWIKGYYDDGKWIDGRWMDERDAEAYKRGPPGKTQMIEISYDDSGRATPLAVEEEEPSEREELHAPPPEL